MSGHFRRSQAQGLAVPTPQAALWARTANARREGNGRRARTHFSAGSAKPYLRGAKVWLWATDLRFCAVHQRLECMASQIAGRAFV